MRIPPVTRALLMLNFGAYLLVNVLAPLSGGDAAFDALIQIFGLRPAAFWQGAVWQPLTSIFLHGSFFHILANMVGLWSIGGFLERSLGSVRYLWLYFISGLAGTLLVLVANPASIQITIGASGAVLGLLGAIAILTPDARLLFLVFPVRARTAALLIGVGSLFFELFGGPGFISNISHLGHLGGLIGGYLYTRFALSADDAHERMYAAGRGGAGGAGNFGSTIFGGPAGGFRTGPSPHGAAPNARSSREEMILRMMEQMIRGQTVGRGDPLDSRGPREKIINPLPEEAEDPRHGSPNYGPGPSARPGGAANRIVYFDPITGRFYIRET